MKYLTLFVAWPAMLLAHIMTQQKNPMWQVIAMFYLVPLGALWVSGVLYGIWFLIFTMIRSIA